jgi:hypothetical protein
MAEPTVEDVAGWLKENPDKEGTTDYVHMASAYKALRAQQKNAAAPAAAPTKSFGEDLWGRAKLAFGAAPEPQPTEAAANVPNLEDIMAAKRLTSDPYNAENTTDRVVTGAIGGIPDLGIALYNAGARTIGSPESQAPYLTPQMQENAGTAPLPADAGAIRQLLEAGGSAFLGGGAGAASSALGGARATAALTGAATPVASTAVRMAAPTVFPTVAGHYAGELGGALGKNYLGDEETGRLLGSLLGGSVMSLAPAARSLVHQRYAGEGRPDAASIDAQSRRQGVTPTAGMLGNDSILRREQVLSGQPGSANVIQDARNTARTGIGNAFDQAAAARGAVDIEPTAGTIGAKVNVAARESAEALRGASDARQVALQDRIGADAPVNVGPIFRRGYDMVTDPAANLTPTQRQGIGDRLTNQLMPLITRNAAGDPIPPGVGHNGGPPMPPPTGETAPYGFVRGFRTELGKEIDTPGGGRMPPAGALYEPTTTALRDTAQRSGVSPQNFDTVQNMTRAVERTEPATPGGPIGDYPTLQRYINEDPAKAYSYLKSGDQNPAVGGILEATQHPGIGEIFGDLIRKIGNETINNPQGGARGPANLANTFTRMNPESRATMLGDQLGNVSDTVGLARALNIPTQQNGLTRALGGQGEGVGRMLIGSETLGKIGGHFGGWPGELAGRIGGILGMPAVRHALASILEGPTVRNALTGGQGPGGINQLGAALTAIQAEQQQQRGPVAQ